MSCPWRLKKTLSSFSIATACSRSCKPSAVRLRMPWGSSVMPTPSSFTTGALSKTRHLMPRACSSSANASPAIPPPTTRISTRLFRLDAVGLHDLAPAGVVARHQRAQLRGCAGELLHALPGESVAHVGHRERFLHVGVDLAHDGGGRVRRR